MSVNIQTGEVSIGGATGSVTVSAYTASKTWLRFTMRADGLDNAWDCQVVGRKATSTSITFERRGNTGTAVIRWWLIESDDFSVQDINAAGPFTGSTNHTISAVTLNRTFVDVSCKQTGNRDLDSHLRARLTSTTNVIVETNGSPSADLEYFVQVVQLAADVNPLVQAVLFTDSVGDEDYVLSTAVSPSKAFVIGSAYRNTTGDWPNVDLHNIRLNSTGTEVEMRRTSQSGGQVNAVVYVVQADCFSVQHNVTTLGVAATSNTAAFSAPNNTNKAFVLCGSYYNESQVWVTSGGPNTSGHTLTPNGAFTSVTAERATAGGTATVEISMVEFVPATGRIEYVNGDTATSNGQSITLNVPTYTNTGDLMIAVVVISNNVATWQTVPAGWTLLHSMTTGGTAPTAPQLYVYYRFASSEPASYTWTATLSGYGLLGGIFTYAQVEQATPWDADFTVATGSSGQVDPASITTITPDAWVLPIGFHDDDDPNTALSVGYTVRALSIAINPTTGNGAGFGVCDVIVASPGSEDPGAWTHLSEEWGAMTLALRPALVDEHNAPFFGCEF